MDENCGYENSYDFSGSTQIIHRLFIDAQTPRLHILIPGAHGYSSLGTKTKRLIPFAAWQCSTHARQADTWRVGVKAVSDAMGARLRFFQAF
jgi:hypothetical protein